MGGRTGAPRLYRNELPARRMIRLRPNKTNPE
jgi:hypothetical protein